MAVRENYEYYINAILDADDMTITEYIDDRCATFSIQEIVERWHGIPGVVLMISTKSSLGEGEKNRRSLSRYLGHVGKHLNNLPKFEDVSVPNKRHIRTVSWKERIRQMEEEHES